MSEKNEPDLCGIKGLYTGENDPFIAACTWHDKSYLERSWQQINTTRSYVDKQFLIQMLTIAGDSTRLKLRAYLYYSLARLFGSTFWEGLSDVSARDKRTDRN